MNPTITLTLLKGDDVAGEYVYTGPLRCVVGRALDSDVCIPADPLYQDVSRHHCSFEIDPPRIRVRDLGSLNGTFVNGLKIGQRENLKWCESDPDGSMSGIELHPGDEVQLGQNTILRVNIYPPPEYAHTDLGVEDEFVLEGRTERVSIY